MQYLIMFKIMNHNTSSQLGNNFMQNNEIHRYNTKHAQLFNTNNLYLHAFLHFGMKNTE